MKYQIIGKNIDITQGIESKVVKKLEYLDKYFIIKDETPCRVVVSVHNHIQKIEVTITTKAGILRGEVESDDLYAAIDVVVDKLEDQMRRVKTRYDRSHREHLGKTFVLDEIKDLKKEPEEPVKTKTISIEALDLDEAIGRMEMLGHSFFIYKDIDANKVAVVYKRNNGGYGLIEVID
jgi:putative sigma-54 modulation protein